MQSHSLLKHLPAEAQTRVTAAPSHVHSAEKERINNESSNSVHSEDKADASSPKWVSATADQGSGQRAAAAADRLETLQKAAFAFPVFPLPLIHLICPNEQCQFKHSNISHQTDVRDGS